MVGLLDACTEHGEPRAGMREYYDFAQHTTGDEQREPEGVDEVAPKFRSDKRMIAVGGQRRRLRHRIWKYVVAGHRGLPVGERPGGSGIRRAQA